MGSEFDPDNITANDMTLLANAIENYIKVLDDIMIIPPEINDKTRDGIKSSMKTCKELIKKLRKGDKSVFKDPDEWNPDL